MKRIPCISCKASSNVKGIGYDAESQTLAVEFTNGNTYHYGNVTPEVHEKFRDADSLGKHFAQHIRGPFGPGTKFVEDEKAPAS